MGAQMSSYVQIAQIDFALGGVMPLSGAPLPPLSQMAGVSPVSAASKEATYYGSDMRWFIWIGGWDFVFPAEKTMD